MNQRSYTRTCTRTDSIDTPRRGHGLTLATLCLAVLVAQVDATVVNLGARAIGAHFSAGVDLLQWVLDGYNVVYAALLLSGGLLADLYGRRRIFMLGAAAFTVASLACALAPDVRVLIGGRMLAGLGAAFMLPASLSIIRVVWPDAATRGRALGIWAGCNGLALAVAPVLGGVLIASFGWRSIFLAVVPLSLAACMLAPRALPASSDPQGRRADVPAQLLAAGALGGVAFAAIQSRVAPIAATVALIAAVLATAGFLRVEAAKGNAAMVPLRMFRLRTFRGAIIATAGMTFGMYGLLFLLPLTWQQSGRFDAVHAGLALMPMALVFVLVSPFSAAMVKRCGAHVVCASGVVIIGVGLLLIGLGAHLLSVVPAEIGVGLTGFGMGCATGPLMGSAIGAVEAARSGTASALVNVARMAGATMGVAVLGAMFAIAHDAADGLRLAMVCGGAVQIVCATVAWSTMRSGDTATPYRAS